MVRVMEWNIYKTRDDRIAFILSRDFLREPPIRGIPNEGYIYGTGGVMYGGQRGGAQTGDFGTTSRPGAISLST